MMTIMERRVALQNIYDNLHNMTKKQLSVLRWDLVNVKIWDATKWETNMLWELLFKVIEIQDAVELVGSENLVIE